MFKTVQTTLVADRDLIAYARLDLLYTRVLFERTSIIGPNREEATPHIRNSVRFGSA